MGGLKDCEASKVLSSVFVSGDALNGSAARGVGRAGELVDGLEELRRLAFEQSVGGEAVDRGHRSSEPVEGRPHDRARWKAAMKDVHGSGRIRLVCFSSPPLALRSREA